MSNKFLSDSSSFDISRRNFLPTLFREIMVQYGLAKGGKACKLSDLVNLPDEQMKKIIPILNITYDVLIDQKTIYILEKKTGLTCKQFPCVPENIAAFNSFNGVNTLGEISCQVALETGWEEKRSFAHCKDLFLILSRNLFFIPKNNLD